MALDETKSLYYKALQNNKKLIDQSNSLVNPTVSNDITTQAYNNTNYDYSSEINQIANTNSITNTSTNKNNGDWYEKILAAADNIYASFIGGFVGAFEGIADVGAYAIGGATGNQDIIDWANHDYASDFKSALYDDNYEYDRETSDVEDFFSEVSQSIGFMLPSIAVGAATGGSSTIAQVASLGTMGTSAMGQGMQESMNEDDDLGKAWLNGAIEGGTEVATEIIVGKVMGSLASGISSKMSDGTAKTLLETLGKTWNDSSGNIINKTAYQGVVQFAGETFEEGMEEVTGDVMKYWLKQAVGIDEEKYTAASLGKSFLSGAVTSAIMTGAGKTVNTAMYNTKALDTIDNYRNAVSEMEEVLKNHPSDSASQEVKTQYAAQLQNAKNQVQIALESFQNALQTLKDNPTARNKRTLNSLLKAINGEKVSYTSDLTDYQKAVDTIQDTYGLDAYKSFTEDFQNKVRATGTEITIEWQSADKFNENEKAFYESKGNRVVINEAYKDDINEIIKHEVFSHAILDANKTIRSSLISDIKNTDSANWRKSTQFVRDNYDGEVTDSEVLANYLQEHLTNKSIDRILANNNITKSRLSSLLTKIKNSLARVKGIDKSIEQSVDKALNYVRTNQFINRMQEAYSKQNISNMVDSEGNKLTKEQAEFFKDSKVRDEDGNLLVVYHGTNNKFTVFDKSKAKATGLYGKGFYFTDSNSVSKSYGNVSSYYLNIVNPVSSINETHSMTESQKLKFIEEISNNEDYGLDNYGQNITPEKVLSKTKDLSDFKFINDLNATSIGDFAKAIEIFNKVNNTNYDGIITPDQIVAFESNQIKLVDNVSPTTNEDIRYSKVKAKSTTKAKKATYKSMQTTSELYDNIVDDINTKVLKDNYEVIVPKNKFSFVETLHSDLTETKINKALKNVMESIDEIQFKSKETGKIYTLKELVDKQTLRDLRKDVRALIKTSPNTEARSKATLTYQRSLDRVSTESRENANRINDTRIVANLINKVKQKVEVKYGTDNTSIASYGLDFLYNSFKELSPKEKGFSAKNFRDNIQTTLDAFTEEKMKELGLPYDEGIRQTLEDLKESLGYPVIQTLKKQSFFDADAQTWVNKERLIYGTLTSESLALTKDAIRKISGWINKENTRINTRTIPSAIESAKKIKKINLGNNPVTRFLTGIKNKYLEAFAPRYVILESLAGGNTELARVIVHATGLATNEYRLFTEKISEKVSTKLKNLKIKITDLNKEVEFNGHKETVGTLLFLYEGLKINFDDYNESGDDAYDSDSFLYSRFKAGEAQDALDTLEKTLTDGQKELANYIAELFNSEEIKGAYIEWYKAKYGTIEGCNALGKVGELVYFPRMRDLNRLPDVTKVYKNPEAIFNHAKSRVKNTNPMLDGDIIQVLSSYTEALGRAKYLLPVYEEYSQMLKGKISDNINLQRVLEQKIGKDNVQYIEDQMQNFLMINQKAKKQSFFDTIMSGYTAATLGFNISTILKQPLSLATSSIPLTMVTKGVANRFDAKYHNEYQQLINGFKNEDGTIDESTIIGGLRYRESAKTLLDANGGVQNKISETVTKPNAMSDRVAMDIGVYALMDIGEKQFKYKVGTKENMNFVKEQWIWFQYSQINRDALSKSAITGGDYNEIVRTILGYMQGAPTAALGSFVTKINLWNRNHKVNKETLKSDLELAKDNMEKAKVGYDKDTSNEEAKAIYQKYRSEYLDVKNRVRDYNRYLTSGGSKIPVAIASGLIVNGLLMTLIGELVKRLKGKKDWDDWDLQELSVSTLEEVLFEWMPMSGTVMNMINGYDISVPAISVINEVQDIFSDFSNGNISNGIWQTVLTISEGLGLPTKNIYNYIYGAFKIFNPDIAYSMNSLLYGSSLTSASQTLNSYIESGNTEKATSMVEIIMKNYKTGEVNEKTADELTRLLMDGYECLPSSKISSYTNEDGDEVKLSSEEQLTFTKAYSKANKIVSDLISTKSYQSLTDENKAKAISKVYNAYYQYAKAKTIGTVKANSKLANLLLFTNGNVDLAKYISYLQYIGTIEKTKTKTRKELVMKYINRTGLTKKEKLLVLALAGYGVSTDNQKSMISYLMQKGMTKNQAKYFLNLLDEDEKDSFENMESN